LCAQRKLRRRLATKESSGSMNAHVLSVVAEGTSVPNRYSGINPALNAACVMAGFLVLLFLVTRLNRDK
jgi:hypothetical protein